VRVEVCRVLKRVGTRDSVAPLEALLAAERDRSVQVAARDALAAIKSRSG
jgi:hypothetical protein